ncbi:MAG TPA: class 1 fructose-bisphosphatase [Polyangiaceae bacterium]|nr:class 1 fructose-bisphosphatase [Polyangiaceae bacterium]
MSESTHPDRISFSSEAPSSSAHQPSSLVGTTLREHVLAGMHAAPGATGQFTSLLNHISLGIRIITSRVRAAGLAGMLGYTGDTNVQGEAVQKLDAFANDVLVNVLERSGHCGLLASEELDEARFATNSGKYVVLFDPLDGSSNIDTNVSIGTIFAILRRRHGEIVPAVEDALQPGRRIIAAGYALYGPQTIFVLSSGHGVDAFTLDPNVGEFFLSHPNIRCPERGNCFSTNDGYYARWPAGVRRWHDWVREENEEEGRPYGHRYVGSLVADAHRTLVKGGIFAYPADTKHPHGKLRLLYEANPMSFLFEQAGGAASDGEKSILDIHPHELHQRTPLIFGSKSDVADFEAFAAEKR